MTSHGQVDGGRACGLRTVRQRRAIVFNARGHEGRRQLGRWTFPAPLGDPNAPSGRTRASCTIRHGARRCGKHSRTWRPASTRRGSDRLALHVRRCASKKSLTFFPQSVGQMMRNSIYAGKVGSPDYGVSTQGNVEPLVDEATFYRAQAVLDGRVVVAGPRQRNHPDFPLRGFVRCDVRPAAHRQLVERSERALRVLPLPTNAAP